MAEAPRGPISPRENSKEVCQTTLIDNETQDDIIALVVFGFTLAIIVGIMGYLIGTFRHG